MWLLTTEGFYSAIRWYDGRICVRGRRRADLDRLRKIVPALSKVEVSPGRDYRYRCFCTVDEWADGMAALAREITYGNFKSEVARKRGKKDQYEKVLHSIWSMLGRLQPAGPYGIGTTRGYPAVPQNEAAAVEKARADRESRWRTTLPTSGQMRIEGPAGAMVCADCGRELEPGEALILEGEALCRDVVKCIDHGGVVHSNT